MTKSETGVEIKRYVSKVGYGSLLEEKRRIIIVDRSNRSEAVIETS